MTTNPLVATAAETPPSAWAGIWICEDIELIAQGVRNGSWIDGTLGVVSAGLDALAFVSDPVGALLQYGIAWLIEHVKPLSEALDWLAGDPAQITAHAQTWRNVAASLRKEAADLAAGVRTDVAGWGGGAGPAYRAWAAEQQRAIGGLAQGADTLAAITEGAAGLVAAVRLLVRDAIATCVSRLIVYAGELVVTGGLAAPLVVEQVTTLVAVVGGADRAAAAGTAGEPAAADAGDPAARRPDRETEAGAQPDRRNRSLRPHGKTPGLGEPGGPTDRTAATTRLAPARRRSDVSHEPFHGDWVRRENAAQHGEGSPP
ncbi:hypothetical protein [Micromonospora echinofusca]|uniref:WXG100-like domain-containing protein n=1 Tax=Micromonospora echinofusca TaxID=47858 RepID=UPI0033FBF1E4